MKYSNILFIAGLFVTFSQIGAMEAPDGRDPYVYGGSSESEYQIQDAYEKARISAIEKEKRRAQMEKQREAMVSGEESTYPTPTFSGEGTYIAPSKRRTGDTNISEKSSLRRPLQREKKY